MRMDEALHPSANLIAHPSKNGQTEIVIADAWRGRVFKTLMYADRRAGEDRATFFGVVADRDHIIEPAAGEFIDRFRAVV